MTDKTPEFVVARADGWEALYENGVKVVEDHQIYRSEAVDVLKKHFDFEWKEDWAQDYIDDGTGLFPVLAADLEFDEGE